MKKKIFIVAGMVCIVCCVIVPVYAQEAADIIQKAKEAVASLERVKMTGKTITAAVNITYTEGAIDYVKAEFFAVEKTDSKIMNSIYLKNGITYMYNGMVDSWFKFGRDVPLFASILDKEKMFSFFPENPQDSGFRIRIIGEEDIEEVPCYVVQSDVSDADLAKQFILDSLDDFVSEELAQELKKNEKILNEYLDYYIQHAETTHWISKDTFFIIKTLSRFRQMTGPNESVSVATQVNYYGFDEPLSISVPPVALDAPRVSAEEMGFDVGEFEPEEETEGQTELEEEPEEKQPAAESESNIEEILQDVTEEKLKDE
jgi:hypothetical protein